MNESRCENRVIKVYYQLLISWETRGEERTSEKRRFWVEFNTSRSIIFLFKIDT